MHLNYALEYLFIEQTKKHLQTINISNKQSLEFPKKSSNLIINLKSNKFYQFRFGQSSHQLIQFKRRILVFEFGKPD